MGGSFMTISYSTPWHKQSFDRFLHKQLPRLLADRLPLLGYDAKSTGLYFCEITISLSTRNGEITLTFSKLPQPDDDGVFEIYGRRQVVLPTASQEDLDVAEIDCVGEQLYAFFDKQLHKAPSDFEWDETVAKSWLPLDAWVHDFFRTSPTSQELDEENRLARQEHLRRFMIPNRENMITASQFGRACPFETPEGSNIGKILHLAMGAVIKDCKIVVIDDKPEAKLGLTATMVPFLEHNEPNRQLFGVNMMRQWFTPTDPEPADVQTGLEPNEPGFWCGRNLLTAFMSLGADTFEDAIVISESAAQRLNYPYPVEPGDKFSNRHGSKGTISKILPDDQMPHQWNTGGIGLQFYRLSYTVEFRADSRSVDELYRPSRGQTCHCSTLSCSKQTRAS
jgi:hypothetical protein